MQTDAELFLYGCELAKSDQGQTLLEGLQLLSGAEIKSCGIDDYESSQQASPNIRREVVFLDTSVADVQQLLDDLLLQNDATRDFEIVLLRNEQDGVAQISEKLSQSKDFDAVHIVSHGTSGRVKLGGSWLDVNNLDSYANQISRWRDSLTANADLLFYGCDFASNADGRTLVNSLAALTGADVAASVDDTGAAILGGNWELEYQIGHLESQIAFSFDVQQNWNNVMAASSPGLAIWRDSGDSSPDYNEWDGVSFGTQGNSTSIGEWRIIQGAESPTRDEKIILGIDTGGTVEGQIWDGSTWSTIPLTMGTVSQTNWWGVDVQYEESSGDAVLVWTDGSNLEYASWNGSSWSIASTISAYSGATPRQLQLAASPDSNEMVLVVSDSNSHDFAMVWNGSTWGNAVTLSTTAGDNRTDIYAAYEQQSGDAMVVYTDNNVDARYRIWNGSSWSTEQTVAAATGVSGKVLWSTLASDPNSDRIALGVGTDLNEIWSAVWNGSSWGSQQLLGTSSTLTAPMVAVAFESSSGDLLTTYSESTTSVKYRAWTSGGGWTAELTGTAIGAIPNSMTLTSDPYSNHIMLSVQDGDNDLHFIQWDGSSWGTDNELESNTGETSNQPFLFLYNRDQSVAQLNPTQDTYLDNNNPGLNYGTSTNLLVDMSGGGIGDGRALLQFDVGAIPIGASITSARLIMEASSVTGTFDISLYEVTEAWEEGTANGTADEANWNDRTSLASWSTAGGTYDSTIIDTANVSAIGTHVWELTSLVQDWYTGSKVNNGLILGSPDVGGNAATFDSNEGTTAPILYVTYASPPNTAPTLDNTKSPALNSINEDAGAPSGVVGTLVSDLVDFASPAGQVDNVTDPDSGASLGIAITAADTTSGSWWYTTNGGTNWNSLGSPSDTNARLLAADASTRLYFQPNTNWSGTLASGITFHAWDHTSGTSGSTADSSTSNTTILDQFGTASYSNNDGTANWAANWIEADDDGLATSGDVQVLGAQLRMHNAAGGALPSISRTVDLSAATSATLSFDYDGNSTGLPERFKVWASDDGGSGWVELDHFTPATSGLFSGNGSYDLGSFISLSNNVVIRFTLEEGFGSGTDYVDFDNVQIVTTTVRTGGSSAFSSASDTASISVTAINDAPTIQSLDGDYRLAINDGTAVFLDVATIASLTDIDSSNLDGGSLQLSGIGFDALDNLGLDTSGTVTLSTGFADSSTVSVSGINIGSLSGVTNSTATISFNVNATTSRISTVLQSFTFGSTATSYGDRSVSFTVIDGDGTANGGTDSDTVNLPVNLASASNGLVATNEDITYVFSASDFDFTGVTSAALREITVTALPAQGTLRLNSSPVTNGQTITKAEIDSGLLEFEPVAEQSGSSYANFSFVVNSGRQAVTVLAGEPSAYTLNSTYLTDTDEILQHSSNFGASGTYPTAINLSDSDSTIDAAYLASGDILFDGYVADANIDAGELTAIDNWVSSGGVLISTNDSASYDPIATHFGLTIGGTANSTWHVADDSHTIMNGAFGLVGNNGDPLQASGSISYFDSASLLVGDVVLATDSVSTEPTIVLRQHGSGWILFIADEGPFRANTTGGGTIGTPNDIFTANVFAWAIDQLSPVTYQVDIDVNAVNDDPVISSNGGGPTASINIVENTTSVATVASTDIDGGAPTYSISGGVDAARFSINSSTGQLSFAIAPNYESPTDSDTDNVYDVTVQVSDGNGGTDSQAITVTVTDSDEFDVSSTTDVDATADAVAENAANGTAVGITAFASDDDGTNNTVTYSLFDNAGGRFAINSSTGVVTVADGTLLNRETAASHNITIRATSADASTSDTVFTINLNDVDEFDVGSITDSDATADSVMENASIGTAVGITALATDDDATNNTITYTLDADAGGRFAINSSSGVITVAGAINREISASHNITVRATSNDTSFSTQVFTINVNDVDEFDVGAVADSDASANSVAENATVGTTVGVTALATDDDATTNAITYSLDDDAGGLFAVNSSTGVVTVASGLDYETATSHNITVRATSADSSFSTQVFSIAVTDVSESGISAISDSDVSSDSVAENSVVGTTTGITAFADDADGTDTVSYSLDDDAGGLFAVNSSTGVVTVAGAIDRESAASHNITVRATSSDTSFSTQVFTINIDDVDEFNVGAISDTNGSVDEVTENATAGTTVGITATASDGDATNNTITYSLDDDAGGRFAINSSSGVITVAGAINREISASHNITVRATSTDSSFSTQVFTINVNDVDEFDVGGVTDSDASANSVAENAIVGTTVGVTAVASDDDATTNTITYSLDNDAGGLFAINGSTGVVTVAGAIDREMAASHNITVRATSTDTSFSTQVFTININDVDEFDVGAISDTNGSVDEVTENATVGTTVGITATASDSDATNNSITYSLDDDAGGLFAINGATGVVTVAGAIDREFAASHNITVRATSNDTSFSTQVFTINVNDVDEFDVGGVTDSDASANSVAENATIGTTVGVTALATDDDATTNAITYSLDDDAGGLFAVNSSTGVVTVASGLDYETATSHNITVRATSADSSFSTQVFSIAVTDVSESGISAITDTDASSDSVTENSVVGTTTGITAFADDADGTDTVSYSLDDDAGGLFAVNSSTGVVTVAGAIDRESAASHNITVRATSSDTSFSTQVFTINIDDVDEFNVGAISDTNGSVDEVTENATAGTTVGITATASDGDATNNTITYSLDDDAGGRFAINSSSGVITVAGAINREISASHNITVRATSTDSSFSTQIFTININDVDEFDVGVVADTDATVNEVAENATVGTAVGITALASDDDATTNAITYSLDDDAGGLFVINSSTGLVTVAGAIDRETSASHNITIRATSADSSFSTQVLTININDVDEFDVGAISDANISVDEVTENATIGTTVGIAATASDSDATINTITYSLDDDAGGLFAINGSTGVVTVAGAINRETSTSHSITVRATSDDTSFSTQVFTIHVNDVDEFDVGAVSDSDASANSIAENATIGTTVGVTTVASDDDATNNTITYSLDDDAGGRFAINGITGVVTVANPLDYETSTTHNITVRATSADASTSTQVFTIVVTDQNDVPPVITASQTYSASELSPNGASLGFVLATDIDTVGTLQNWAITAGNVDGIFAINASTGELTIGDNTHLDYETTSSYVLTLTVSDGINTSSSETIAIAITDENDVAPVITTSQAFSVNELAANATSLGTVLASDLDTVGTLQGWTITAGNSDGVFVIDSNSGEITIADNSNLDYESTNNYTLTLTVSDGINTSLTETVSIVVIDANDNAPVIAPLQSFTVSESATTGTSVGNVVANDVDTGTVLQSWVILAGNADNIFAIDANSGEITIADPSNLDFEATSTYSLTLAVGDGLQTSAPEVVVVNVTGCQ